MKSFIETSPGIITFRALPYPLPAHTQELLKDSSAVLAALNDAIEKAATKPAKKKQSTNITLLPRFRTARRIIADVPRRRNDSPDHPFAPSCITAPNPRRLKLNYSHSGAVIGF